MTEALKPARNALDISCWRSWIHMWGDSDAQATVLTFLETVLRVAEESELGRATGTRLRVVLLGQHAVHHVPTDLYCEGEGELLGDPPAAEARIASFHLAA